MSVDYDLIIFGATSAGIQAAISAATLKARVALITQGVSPGSTTEAPSYHALLHLANKTESLRQFQALPLWCSPPASSTISWERVNAWLEAIMSNVEAMRSGAVLAYQGVDVITAMGEFCRKPTMGVRVADRFLQARGYLLAMDVQPRIPAIAGIETVNYLTSETLPSKIGTLASVQKVIVIGSGKVAVEVAQAMLRLGIEATILTQERCLLPTADRSISQFIQTQLEAEGARLRLNTSIDQIRQSSNKQQILVGTTTLECDAIILAAGHASNLASLNLNAVGVQWHSLNTPHTEKLQTSNPHIYVCEGRRGNECFSPLATYEATIALKNILFFPWYKPNYQFIPQAIHTTPELAWLGLAEDQALQTYGSKAVYVLHHPFHALAKAQLQNDLNGFCKLIVHRDGTLLGAQIAGKQASEWIGILALAMQQRLKIGAIVALPIPSPTFAEILHYAASNFRRYHFQQNHRLQDLTDHFFDLRRAWARN